MKGRLRLVEIGQYGQPSEDLPLSDMTQSACEAAAQLYRQVGFQRPWIGYLAQRDDQVVGMCAFKSPPVNGRVEIAYATAPGHEGQGIATQMARQLIQLAVKADRTVGIIAQTLSQENASTSILRKLGFVRTGTVDHPDDGLVWEWEWTGPDDGFGLAEAVS